MSGFPNKLLTYCENFLTNLAVVSTFGMMFLTTADGAGRYVFNRPIIGAYEITEKYLMVSIVFLGICFAYRGGSFIRVTFFVDRLPRKMKVALNYFVQIFSVLLGGVLFAATLQQALHTIADGVTLSVLAFPLGPAYMIVPVGLFSMTLLMLLDLRRVGTGKSDLVREEERVTTEAV